MSIDAPPLPALGDLDRQLMGWDACETVARIRSGEVSAAEVVEAAIGRAQAWAPTLGAVVTEDYDRARRSRGAPGPLEGVPTFIKDLDDLAGLPTGMGSRAVPLSPVRATAACVDQFLSTGPVVLGKSSTAEFGLTCTTEPVGGPPTRNPHDLGRAAGGSSGGAAALVAAGVVPLAYGSDGGGSIRIPASFCGLVGLKPSRGRLKAMDRSQMMPVRIATYGVLTRSVRDTWAFYAGVERGGIARGLAPVGTMAARRDERLRIGFFTDAPGDGEVDPEVAAAVQETAAALAELGHVLTPLANPFSKEVLEDFLFYWSLLAAAVERLVAGTRGADPARLEPWTRSLAAEFRRAWTRAPGCVWRLRRFGRVYAERLSELDVLMGPTTGAPAPPLGALSPSQDLAIKRPRVEQLVPFTPIQNISGAPAISLPLGRSSAGLPIGVQLAGRVGEEARLLSLAAALEEARPWDGIPQAVVRAVDRASD